MEIIDPDANIQFDHTEWKILSEFKTTVVIPFHKTETKTTVSKYRPVNLIRNFA